MSIEINDYTYKYEDEDLDDVEYLEIMSLDDIIKDNPSFIALSKNDIQDNLFNMFSKKKKADNVANLFYEILNDINEKRGILNNYDNYIFNVEAKKNEYDTNGKKDKEDAIYFNKLENRENLQFEEAKNKYFFCIKFNNESTNIRFIQKENIIVSLEPYHNTEFPIYYPIFSRDNVEIPIVSAFYKIQKTTINDNLCDKITSTYMINNKNINLRKADNYENTKELIKDVRPNIQAIIAYMQDNDNDNFTQDYNNINVIFKKFGKSLDLINEYEYDILYNYMVSITEYEKERKNISKPIKIKKCDILNKKLIFFDKLKSILNLLDLDEKTTSFLEKNKNSLEKHLSSIILTDEKLNLENLNLYNLISHINEVEDVEIEKILINIRQSIHISSIKATITEIEKILKTNEKKSEIINNYEMLRNKFEYSRNHILDYDKDGKQYLISYREVKEIKEAEYNENYEGIPMINNMEDNINTDDLDNIAYEQYDVKYVVDTIDINKYLTNVNYKSEEGFIDAIKIILPELAEISKICNIEIDYDILCSELFKYDRSITSKKNIYINEFNNRNVELNKKLLNILDKIAPKHIININGLVNQLDKETIDIIQIANNIWLSSIKEMFIHAISFWIIYVQEKILEDTLPLDENYLNDNFIINWYRYGSPFNNLKKSEEKGVLPYIINVTKEYLTNKNELFINIENLLKNTIKHIESKYMINLEKMRSTYELLKNKKKEMRGLIEQDKFKILRDNKECAKNPNLCKEQHIKSLIYMPDINYVKLHKFLNGCCLKKLDDTFSDDIDLKNAKRKDLMAWKKEFAKKRLTNKVRDLRFIPEIINTALNIKDKINVFSEDIKYNISYSNIISIWLNEMRIRDNSIFSGKIIDDIENNAKKIDIAIKNNINILAKTSKNLKSDNFINSFYKDKIKYKSLILTIIKILYNFSKKKDNLELTLLIDISIKDLQNIIIDLNRLNSIILEDNEIDTERINKYIVSRALCCPLDPDQLINGCLSSNIINNSVIQELTKIIYTEIMKIIELTFPNAEDNINFLNEQREKNKQNKINILNDKTVEENLLIKELKKAGIKHKIMNEKKEELEDINDDEDNGNNHSNILNNIYNNDDDNAIDKYDDEHKLNSYDNESDDDLMLQEDMGFIYN